MKNVFKMVILGLIVLGVTPLLAEAESTRSEMTEYYMKMRAFEKDLIDLGEYSQGADQAAAIRLIDVAVEYSTKIDQLRDLLLILTIIENNDDRSRVMPVVVASMKNVAGGIDISLKKINLEMSQTRSNAIISTGNQMKTELRELQKLLAEQVL